MKIEYVNELLFANIKITYKGKTKNIDNVIVDTGAAHSLLSVDSVSDIGISVNYGDSIVTMYGIGGEDYAFRRMVDKIELGSIEIENCYIDFGMLDVRYGINGLIGLDLLMREKVIIDLNILRVFRS